jgi:UDP-2-acetamido-3-amino-2,3-dideoxy-glucuronate N-acetyltransferase
MSSEPQIHPTAVIDPGAIIGVDTRIWHFCHVMPTAVVGAGCNIGQNVFIDNNVQIGSGVKIQNNVSLYNGVTLEDNVFIGPSVVFTNVTNPRSFIERKHAFKPTLVKKGASIGANATILCGVVIGEFAMVGAGAVVTKDVAPYSLVVGNPASVTGTVNEDGEKD